MGFLGLTAPRSASYPQTKGWTITDPIAAAKEWIPKAREHCDILIAMTHIGTDLDKQLAGQTTGLDAIVGGDSHTFLYKAMEAINPEGRKIPIVQDGEFGVNLGRFDLHFNRASDGKWNLAGYDYQLLPAGGKIKEAPDVAAALEHYIRPYRIIVGHLSKIGATPAERAQITNQVIAEAMRTGFEADYALNPDDSAFEFFRHKEVSRYEIYAILPFKNRVVIANLTGAEIQGLQKTVANSVISGNLTALDPGKTYKVALVDYAARSGYKLPEERLLPTGKDLRDVVMAYLNRPASGQ